MALILEALELGITADEIRAFLNTHSTIKNGLVHLN
ncbi:DNA-binding anti-repressor SinI [Neobacillus niacini]